MTQIAATASPGSAPASTPVAPGSTLGKDDFLKLLVAQLKYQDPMKPMEDTQFIGQMAQFSTLEQISNLSKTNEGLLNAAQTSQNVALIGRRVRYKDADGETREGVVEKVLVADGKPTLTVSGHGGVAGSSVTEVS